MIMTNDQLTIDFQPEPNLGREDFILGACNALAADWIDRWPDWPGRIRGLVIHGPADCGKSHLGTIWSRMNGARTLKHIDENTLATIAPGAHLLLDHPAPGSAWPDDQFFHLLNHLTDGEGSVLILSRLPMSQFNWALPDLMSRLNGLPAAEITAPEDDLLIAVMQKQAEDLGFSLDGDIARYICHRIERSFSAAGQTVQQVNAVALSRKKKVTIAMVRDLLDQIEPRLV